MGEIDTVDFIRKNGRDFFCSDEQHSGDMSELVEISLELVLTKAVLQQVAAHCRKEGRTIPEFLAEVVEGWFE